MDQEIFETIKTALSNCLWVSQDLVYTDQKLVARILKRMKVIEYKSSNNGLKPYALYNTELDYICSSLYYILESNKHLKQGNDLYDFCSGAKHVIVFSRNLPTRNEVFLARGYVPKHGRKFFYLRYRDKLTFIKTQEEKYTMHERYADIL